METNCYIFGSAKSREVAIIDPGGDYDKIKKVIDKENLKPLLIINTHGHIDHMGANYKFKIPVYIHKEDSDFLTNPLKSLSAFYADSAVSPKPKHILKDGDEIEISDIRLKVLYTPGHTPGGISLYYDGIVFTGDALFKGGIGRTDLPYGDQKALVDSIKNKLMSMDDKVRVFPGHGPSTTIGEERRDNPWL
jgi:glyoxylase-like metal-dependent hydrolase (beta-lactamase superfamily II)